jgi:hypothetical protein
MSALRLYLPLIGIPAVALIGVLRIGEGLRAPPGLHGDWSVREARAEAPFPATAEPSTSSDAGCLPKDLADSLRRLTIAQSGPNATVSILGPELTRWARGAIRVREGAATGVLTGAESSPDRCGGAPALAIAFAGAVPDTLHVTLARPGCSTCATIRFIATRRPRSAD